MRYLLLGLLLCCQEQESVVSVSQKLSLVPECTRAESDCADLEESVIMFSNLWPTTTGKSVAYKCDDQEIRPPLWLDGNARYRLTITSSAIGKTVLVQDRPFKRHLSTWMGDHQEVIDLGYMAPNEGLIIGLAQFGYGAICGPMYNDVIPAVPVNEVTHFMIWPDCFGAGVTFIVIEKRETCWQALD